MFIYQLQSVPKTSARVPTKSREIISQRILAALKQKGKITYKELMEIMLYNPSEGFYTQHPIIAPCTQSVIRDIAQIPHLGSPIEVLALEKRG